MWIHENNLATRSDEKQKDHKWKSFSYDILFLFRKKLLNICIIIGVIPKFNK